MERLGGDFHCGSRDFSRLPLPSSASILRRKSLVGCLILIWLTVARSLQGADSATTQQFWPALDLYVNVNEDSRFFFQYSATRQADLQDYEDGLVGAYFDYYTLPLARKRLAEQPDAARDKFLMFRMGFAYQANPPDKKPSTQYIGVLEVDPRQPLPWGMLMTDRNRMEFRLVNGDYEPRYRNRLRIERTFKVGRFGLTPYIDCEAFYESQYHAWAEIRYEGGMEWAIKRYLVLQGYYTRQRETQPKNSYVNALGATLQIYLRQSK